MVREGKLGEEKGERVHEQEKERVIIFLGRQIAQL